MRGKWHEHVRRKARELGIVIPADRVLGRSRRVDPARVLREFMDTLESLVPSVELIEPAKIDAAVISDALASLDVSIRALNRLRRRLGGKR